MQRHRPSGAERLLAGHAGEGQQARTEFQQPALRIGNPRQVGAELDRMTALFHALPERSPHVCAWIGDLDHADQDRLDGAILVAHRLHRGQELACAAVGSEADRFDLSAFERTTQIRSGIREQVGQQLDEGASERRSAGRTGHRQQLAVQTRAAQVAVEQAEPDRQVIEDGRVLEERASF